MLTAAIIGAGQIAGGYDESKLLDDGGVYTHAGAYARTPGIALECVCDTDAAKAEHFRQHWNLKRSVRSVDEILSSHFDIVSVCTPDAAHYDVIRALLESRCCKTIYAEKPLAPALGQIDELLRLSRETGINVVVNFQRRFDTVYDRLRKVVTANAGRLLTANVLYMKGLDHSGVTAIDTITAICGQPSGVLAYSRTFNTQIEEFSYDFTLFYNEFTVGVKSIDSAHYHYTYHIFEVDLLFADRRVTLNDNSRQCETRELTGYAYSGVRVLDDHNPTRTDTDYKHAIGLGVDYVRAITLGERAHTINTPQASYNTMLIIDSIKSSFEMKREVRFEDTQWKK